MVWDTTNCAVRTLRAPHVFLHDFVWLLCKSSKLIRYTSSVDTLPQTLHTVAQEM